MAGLNKTMGIGGILASAPEPQRLAIATGASGRTYEFQIDRIGSPYFPRPGVYFFGKLIAVDDWQAVYWGETDNFHRRLSEELMFHHRWTCIRAEGATHIGSLHVPGDPALRRDIETDLRCRNPTTCNRQ